MSIKISNPTPGTIESLDPLWTRLRNEAEGVVASEPALAGFMYTYILNHERLENAVAHRIADRLDSPAFDGDLIKRAFTEMMQGRPRLSGRPPCRPRCGLRSRSRMHAVPGANPLFQGLPRHSDAPTGALAPRHKAPRLRLLAAEPGFPGLPG